MKKIKIKFRNLYPKIPEKSHVVEFLKFDLCPQDPLGSKIYSQNVFLSQLKTLLDLRDDFGQKSVQNLKFLLCLNSSKIR